MKVLFLTDGIFPFQLGGMQKHSLILSQLLHQNGVDLHIAHTGGEGYSKDAFNDLYKGGSGELAETVIPFPKTDTFPGHYIRENKKYSKQIYSNLESQLDSFDLIYAQGYTSWHFLKKSVDIPVLVNFHGFEMFQMAPSFKVKLQHYLLRPAVKEIISKADGVYSFGGKIDDLLVGLGVSKSKILEQSNGISSDWIKPEIHTTDKDHLKFIFIGRNERRKGVAELNMAISKILENPQNQSEFHFVGPLPEDFDHPAVFYHGEVRDMEKIRMLLDESDCLLCPSFSEGMPTVILEAMARGLAIIATDVGAVSRMIRSNGVLLDATDPSKIENAIQNIQNCDSSELDQMKRNSIDLVKEKFIWEKIAQKKLAQFNEIKGQ